MKGLFLEVAGADFSSVAQGFVGPHTSVETPTGLFDLRESSKRARFNGSGGEPATFSGANPPVISATHITTSAVGSVNFPDRPSNSGGVTIAMVVKIKSAGGIFDGATGNGPLAQATDGRIMFTNGGGRVGGIVHTFNDQTSPSAAGTQRVIPQILTTGRDGEWCLYVVTAESEVALTLYEPSTSVSKVFALSAGDFVYNNQSGTDNFFRLNSTAAATQDVALFAYWDRAITSGEVATFYNEMKAYLLGEGLTIS